MCKNYPSILCDIQIRPSKLKITNIWYINVFATILISLKDIRFVCGSYLILDKINSFIFFEMDIEEEVHVKYDMRSVFFGLIKIYNSILILFYAD